MTYDPGLGALEHTQPNGRRGGDVDPTLAVVVARLDDLREDMKALRAEVRSSTANVVGRGEWVQRNNLVDGKFDTHGREIAHLRTDLAARRTPWPAVAGAVTGIGSLLIVLIQNIGS